MVSWAENWSEAIPSCKVGQETTSRQTQQDVGAGRTGSDGQSIAKCDAGNRKITKSQTPCSLLFCVIGTTTDQTPEAQENKAYLPKRS